MKNYNITVSWEMAGTIQVEAENLQDALKLAEKMSPSDTIDREYISDSWIVFEEDE